MGIVTPDGPSCCYIASSLESTRVKGACVVLDVLVTLAPATWVNMLHWWLQSCAM